MPIVPETRTGKITFYQSHLSAWSADPASIGLTSDAVDALTTLVDEAKAAFAQQQEAETAARAATSRFHEAVRRMHAGGDGVAGGAVMIESIKTHARMTGDNAVYTRALIPPPSKPGRAGSSPPPGTPTSFVSTMRQTGEVVLTWKCDNPDGTVGTTYQIERQLDDGPMHRVAIVGEKRFMDRTIPPGTRRCKYQLTAMRSTGKGSTAEYEISIGCADAIVGMKVPSRRLVA